MGKWFLVLAALFIAGCSSKADTCLDRLGENYPRLSFDENSAEYEQTQDGVSGLIKLREKGSNDYSVKRFSCEFEGDRLVLAECPGCP